MNNQNEEFPWESSLDFFEAFLVDVKRTPEWTALRNTSERSAWHREPTVAIHTLMTIYSYIEEYSRLRTNRQRILTLMALLFHDFGKPESEEVLEKKDEPGVFYRRYPGHEPISGNVFISFMCDYPDLRQRFFNQGFDWGDIRKIKFMIEHHLPFGLKNVRKREDLRQAVGLTMGVDEQCYWDMLRADARGRISDDHATKVQTVDTWIEEFDPIPWAHRAHRASMVKKTKTLCLLVGASGSGKTHWTKQGYLENSVTFDEDALRLEYAMNNLDNVDLEYWPLMSEAEQHEAAVKFCHFSHRSDFEDFAKEKYKQLIATGRNIVVDAKNPGRKVRNRYVHPAREAGYEVHSIEFFISEKVALERQRNRQDKFVPEDRLHKVFMAMEVPWLGPEIDRFSIVAPT